MKNIIKKFAICAGIIIGNVTPVLAATTGFKDNSDLFVWIFLSFCASIIVAQLIPAIMVLVGSIKGLKKKTEEVASVVVDKPVE